MRREPKSVRQIVASDIVECVEEFRRRKTKPLALLNRIMNRSEDFRQIPPVDVGDLEDLWIDMESVYAAALEAGQTVLTEVQATQVEDAINRLAEAVAEAL